MGASKISDTVLNTVYESVGDGVCVNEIMYNDYGIPVDYIIIDTNPAYESITGFRREEIAGQRASVVYNTENPPHLNIYARVADTGDKANFETYFSQKGKHFNVSVISPEKGKFITIFTDITGHSDIDDELETVYENVPVVLMMVDSYRRILKLNKNAELFAGESSDKLIGSRGGEALGCLYSLDDPEGCGFGPHCKDCIVKNTVLDTFETGINHYNIETCLPFRVDGHVKNLTFLLSTSLINTENKSKILVSILDITERKETEKELKESEERFRVLTEKAADAIIAHDFDGNILYANETAGKNLGYTRDELLSLNVTDIDPYVNVDIFRDKYWNKTSSNTSYFVGTYHKRKDGTVFPVEVRLTRINFNEKPVILAYIRDITIQKKAEDNLISEKYFFEKVAETSPIGITKVDEYGRIVYANSTAEKVLGLLTGDIKNRTYDDVKWNISDFNGNYYPKENLPFELVKKYKKPVYDVRHAIEWPDDQRKLLSINAAPIFDENNQFDGMVSTIDDITEKVKKDEELKQSEQKFRNYVDNSPISIFVINKNGFYIDVNKTATYVTGYSKDELLKMNIYDLTPDDAYELLHQALTQLVETGNISVELPFITKTDNKRYRVLDAVKLSDDKYLGFTTDITERKKVEEDLKRQKEQVIETERTRQLELHHRIKNNLQVISSLLNLQSEKFTDDNVKNAFIDTQNRVISMSLVHNKLYQTKGLEKLNTKNYVDELIDHLTELYRRPNIDINIDVQDIHLGIDAIIPLGMLINEIVSNSLKHAFSESELGEVKIQFYQNSNRNYTLIIADNGRGLPEDLDVKEADTLGLQLINSLIDQIDGVFEVNTNNGTEFVIEFDG